MATGTLQDLTDEEKMKLNELLSRSTVTSQNDIGYVNGEANWPVTQRMGPPVQSQPQLSDLLPSNTIRNNSTGRVFQPTGMNGQPSQSQGVAGASGMSGLPLDYSQSSVKTPYGTGQYLKGDSTRMMITDGPQFGKIVDLGRDTGAERARTKENLALDAQRATIAHTQAQTEAARQKPTEPEALRTIKGAMEIYKSLPDGGMKRAFGEKYGLEVKRVDEKPLPGPAVDKISAAGSSVENMERSRSTFKNDYAGKTVLGDLSNTIGRVFGDDTGQTQWWQDFDVAQAQARHALFGSALTNTEKTAWEKISINPRMDPEEIRKNLERRQAIEARAASKLARAYAAGGYSQAQIKELLGTSAGVLDTPAPPVADPSGKTAVSPPEVGTFEDGYVFKGGNPADKASWMRK